MVCSMFDGSYWPGAQSQLAAAPKSLNNIARRALQGHAWPVHRHSTLCNKVVEPSQVAQADVASGGKTIRTEASSRTM